MQQTPDVQQNASGENASGPEAPPGPSGEPVHASCPLCGEGIDVLGGDGPIQIQCPSCLLRFTLDLSGPADPNDNDATAGGEDSCDPGELERWLAGEPVPVRVLNDRQRLWRWCRSRPCLSGLLGTALLALVATAVVGPAGYWRTRAKLDVAQRRWAGAERGRRRAVVVAAAATQLVNGKQGLAESEMASRQAAERRAQQAEARCREAQQQCRRAEQAQAAVRREVRIAFARELGRDAQRFLASHPQYSLFLAGASLRAELQEGVPPDHLTQQVLRDALALTDPQGLPGHQGAVQAMAVSPAGGWLVTGGSDQTARLWNLSAEDPLASSIVLAGAHGQISAVAISPDAHWVATASDDATVMLWDLTAKDVSASPIVLRGHRGRVRALAFSPDGRTLVTAGGDLGGNDHAARLWDLTAEDPAAAPMLLRGHDQPILEVTVSPDGRWLITAGQDKSIRLWNLTARYPAAEQVVLRGHDGWITSLAVSPDSRWLASSGSCDNTARLWDLRDPDPWADPIVLKGHADWLAAVAISPNGRWLATGSFDKTVRLWDLTAADPAAGPLTLEGHADRIRALAFSPDSHWLASGSADTTVRLWNLAGDNSSAAPVVLRGHAGPINTLAVSSDSHWLIAGSEATAEGKGNTVRVWDIGLQTLLETARRAGRRHLSDAQRQRLLLEAARSGDALR